MPIPEPVRTLAVYPFRELPKPPDVERVDFDGAWIGFNGWPTAQMGFFEGAQPGDVARIVDEARAAARARGKATLAWWVPPEDDALAPQLEACGLVNEDTPGFESIENAMALVEEPPAEIAPDLEIRIAETWEDWRAASDVVKAAFGMPDVPEEVLRERYEEYRNPENHGRSFVAFADGRAVGNSYAAFGQAGINLFGGAVLAEFRGRGVYRSLVRARWDHAVERGTPALTVQAGRMSRPILERLGFEFIAPVRVFVDRLD
jgi:GNAT superfamily N-acetyltransferase